MKKRNYKAEAPQAWLFNCAEHNAATYGTQQAKQIEAIKWFLSKEQQPVKINHSDDAVAYIRSQIALNSYESFYVMYLTRAHEVIKGEVTNIGAAAATVADIPRIVKNAILCNAQSVIIAHNHPSGNLKPSEADLSITVKLCEALKLFDIQLIDSLIVTVHSHKCIPT
jgi:DNA repair protein RadC